MAYLLKHANHTAQWYQPLYPAAASFTHLEKFLIHTTETRDWAGYAGGASAPNATYNPRRREIRQHFYADRSARALRDPDSTPVRENRDNVFQLEMVCYSDKAVAESVGGLWVADLAEAHYLDLAAIIDELHDALDLPVRTSVEWRPGATTDYNPPRLTSAGYDGYRGILGHIHAPGNTHWDPGGFRYPRLADALARLTTPIPTVDLSRIQYAARHAGDMHYPAGVHLVERSLLYRGLLGLAKTDGRWTDATTHAYSRWQGRLGYRGADADGIPGRVSLTKLGNLTPRFQVIA